MNKTFFFLSCACFLMSACTKSDKKGGSRPVSDSIHVEAAPDSVIYPADSDTIGMNIVNGMGTLRIHKKERQGIALKFNSMGYKRMTGKLTSADANANIRFDQIVLPGGEMDGPFSRDIAYDLPVKGDYVLFIHEDQMAGDPWSGDFEVTVSLSN